MTRLRICLLLLVAAGCNDRPAGTGPASSTGTVATTATVTTFDRQPEVLLSSRKPDRLIVAIDFAGSRAMDPSVPLDERRKYVLERAVALYAGYAKKERDDQPVRLMALSVPNRDDYARGDFRNMDELAILDTDHATAKATAKPIANRAGKVEWRAGLSREGSLGDTRAAMTKEGAASGEAHSDLARGLP